jgi:hypothetical protein
MTMRCAGLALWAVACRESASTARVIDSSGVRIVESMTPRWRGGVAWHVDTVPMLDLAGAGEGEVYEFGRVSGAVRWADGSLAVANGETAEVRAYSHTGAWRWTAGKRGEGPGEFNRLSGLAAYRGDSLVAFDFWLGRATLLSAAGQVGRTFTVSRPGTRVRRLVALSDTTFLAMVIGADESAARVGRVRYPAALVRTGREGTILDTLWTLPSEESYLAEMGDIRPLFAHNAHIASRGGGLIAGSGDSLDYRVYSPRGDLASIVRRPGVDLTVTRAEADQERASYLTPDSPSWLRALVASLPVPATRPAFDQLVVDAEGAVWLRPYVSPGAAPGPVDWEVFDPLGIWLGTVALPSRLRVFEIGAAYVLGVYRDGEGVDRVQVRTLHRTPGAA